MLIYYKRKQRVKTEVSEWSKERDLRSLERELIAGSNPAFRNFCRHGMFLRYFLSFDLPCFFIIFLTLPFLVLA